MTIALIADMPPFVVGALRLRRPGVPWSPLTIVKINPSRFCDSGELNVIEAVLVSAESVPLIVPLKVIESNGKLKFVTVRVKVSLTVSSVLACRREEAQADVTRRAGP